jgi:hypothetical protein
MLYSIEVTVNSKKETLKDFCLDFVQEFGLWSKSDSDIFKIIFVKNNVNCSENFSNK